MKGINILFPVNGQGETSIKIKLTLKKLRQESYLNLCFHKNYLFLIFMVGKSITKDQSSIYRAFVKLL